MYICLYKTFKFHKPWQNTFNFGYSVLTLKQTDQTKMFTPRIKMTLFSGVPELKFYEMGISVHAMFWLSIKMETILE